MSSPVNLNKLRKAHAQKQAEVRAAENRVKFGRTKIEKALAKARSTKANRDLLGHLRER